MRLLCRLLRHPIQHTPYIAKNLRVTVSQCYCGDKGTLRISTLPEVQMGRWLN